MHTTLRKMGNSTGLILPKAILEELGLASGARIDVVISEGAVVATPVRRKVREGWEEAAKRIGALGLTEEEQEWLDMPSDFDSEWEW